MVSARLRAAASTRNTEQLPEVVRPSALHAAELYIHLDVRIAARACVQRAQRERRRTIFYLKKQNKTKKPKQSSKGREVRRVEPAVNYLCFLFAHPSPPSTALVEFGSVLVCPPPLLSSPPRSLPLIAIRVPVLSPPLSMCGRLRATRSPSAISENALSFSPSPLQADMKT